MLSKFAAGVAMTLCLLCLLGGVVALVNYGEGHVCVMFWLIAASFCYLSIQIDKEGAEAYRRRYGRGSPYAGKR